MQITYFSDYSLRVLIYLGIKTDKASISEISEAFGVSKNHLMKAVHRLNKLGYVKSIRGKMGGITLACPPESINIGNIIQQLEPHMNIVECFDRRTDFCIITPACKLKGVFHEATSAFLGTLKKYTLADLMQNKKALTRSMRARSDKEVLAAPDIPVKNP